MSVRRQRPSPELKPPRDVQHRLRVWPRQGHTGQARSPRENRQHGGGMNEGANACMNAGPLKQGDWPGTLAALTWQDANIAGDLPELRTGLCRWHTLGIRPRNRD